MKHNRRTTLDFFAHTRKILLDPGAIVRGVLKRWHLGSFETRLKYDAFRYPYYAYGTYEAAIQAKALGIPRISVIEFGVAGGTGLVELERIACEVHDATGVAVDVYGFDAGSGMPEPTDYRDLPYAWQKGFFAMDEAVLRARLAKTTTLIIGDVRETAAAFIATHHPAPIGFISFDLDYYSSTMDAFALLAADAAHFLPRVFAHFDDVIGGDIELHSEFVGELLAIKEFNAAHAHCKIAPINGLSHKRFNPQYWNDMQFVIHRFDHPLYAKPVVGDLQLPLR